ncbi:hypothetical protein BHAMNSH16_11490 [Brachyspira hampsonii]|uniref:Uncharacterized protein n=2 Tax=Brachyspira hampsonii TaxID=1287055 RepID=A0AAC9TU03_9SPIR|nr:hypothetical protein [Brachyspira hampsonii]ASJ22225.1 hypothetical protein BHAMNSH16_11490 [Brachyspira hampsonii]MBW5410005.1 hypothetical protein [Brachyspira hampsonii]OEJ19075.1 hypothetical protein A9496_05205 [Brachyspira hampsonii]
MNKILLSIIVLISAVLLSSCKAADSINEYRKLKDIESTEDYGPLGDFLKTLPKTEEENAQSPYNELTTFITGRNQILSSSYKEGFETLARFLFTYPSSYYESEASYLLGQTLIYMVENEPAYIEEFYTQLLSEGIVEGEENNDDEAVTNLQSSLKNIYNQMGIIAKDGQYSFNGYIFDRILQDEESVFPLKDFAYYFSIRHRFSSIQNENDKAKFITNITYLRRFSDRYRTSVLQDSILHNQSYFPDNLPFTLTSAENKNYKGTMETVQKRIDAIKAEFEEEYYVIGNGIIIRDRIPAITPGTEKELYTLYNYDFVTVLNKTNVYNPKERAREDWALVKYDTYYGPIVGWSYLRYMTNNIQNMGDIFENYKAAMNSYKNYDYLKSSDFFSYILNDPNTNYFTDKSVYFLWKVNNKIGELVSSKNNPYYKYVLDYPKYFYYNTNNNVLQSSTLLYNYLVKILPTNPYRFVISGDSEAEYSVD